MHVVFTVNHALQLPSASAKKHGSRATLAPAWAAASGLALGRILQLISQVREREFSDALV